MGNSVNKISGTERRSGTDRRKDAPPLFCKYWFSGSRSLPRRQEDRQTSQQVDRYNKKILVLIMFTLVLSILDAVFTLILVEKGAKEVNPFMAYYLNHGPMTFFWIKYLLTCGSVLIVLFIKDCYIFRTNIKAKFLFFLLPIPFILVIPWQLGLMFLSF